MAGNDDHSRDIISDAVPMSMPQCSDIETRNDMLSNDWEFNYKLANLARKITESDLKFMKHLISGEGGTSRGTLERITDGIDLINHLKHRGFLDKHNLLHLQALVWTTKNMELREELVKFVSRYREEPLHFFSPNADNGDFAFVEYTEDMFSVPTQTLYFKQEDKNQAEDQENVQFHISGRATSRTVVENLQSLVAKYLCVPEHCVILNGVRPFRSIVITFLVPCQTSKLLLALSSYQKGILLDMDIDKLTIGVTEVILKGKTFDRPSTLTEDDEIQRISTAKIKLEKELEKTQHELLQKERELKAVFKEYNHIKRAYQDLTSQTVTILDREIGQVVQDNNETMEEEDLFADEHVKSQAPTKLDFPIYSPENQQKD